MVAASLFGLVVVVEHGGFTMKDFSFSVLIRFFFWGTWCHVVLHLVRSDGSLGRQWGNCSTPKVQYVLVVNRCLSLHVWTEAKANGRPHEDSNNSNANNNANNTKPSLSLSLDSNSNNTNTNNTLHVC